MTVVWLHGVNVGALAAGVLDDGCWIFAEGRLPPELKLHLADEWDEVARRSEDDEARFL